MVNLINNSAFIFFMQKDLEDKDGKIIIPKNERVELKQFNYGKFIIRQGDFYWHFVEGDSIFCTARQKTPHYKRFQHNYSDLDALLRNQDTAQNFKKQSYKNMEEFRQNLPNDYLFQAYSIMCKLVSIKDKGVLDKEKKVDEYFLTH